MAQHCKKLTDSFDPHATIADMIRAISFDEWMSLLQQLFAHLLKELQTAKRVHKNILDLLQAALPPSYFHDLSIASKTVLLSDSKDRGSAEIPPASLSPQPQIDVNTSDVMSEFLELTEHNIDEDQSLTRNDALALLDPKQPDDLHGPSSPPLSHRKQYSESERGPLDMFGATSPPQTGIPHNLTAPTDALPDDVIISRANFKLLVESSENIAAEACAEAQERLGKLFSARGKDGVDDKLPAQKYAIYADETNLN